MKEKTEFLSILYSVFEKNGLLPYINEEKAEKFYDLTKIMLETNEKMNLTAITEVSDVVTLHYADSLLMLRAEISEGTRICDVGCGGGFPCLPLAIVCDGVSITGVDSTAKKVAYVNETAKALGLKNLTAVSGRAEELAAAEENMRESFDVVCARAVAALPMLSELCLPFVKVGGRFISLKSRMGDDELRDSANGIKLLGGRVQNNIKTELLTAKEGEIFERTLITVKKEAKTPPKYPRPFGQIKKKPL